MKMQKWQSMAGATAVVLGMWAGAAQAVGPVPVTVQGVTGHDGGNYGTSLGHLTDMLNGNLSYDFGSGDHNPGMDISANPSDPSTWTYAGNNWQQEWKANSRLDPGTSSNSKIGWAVLDLGSEVSGLGNMYLWNVRSQSTTENVDTYNIYYATTPTASLPAMPNSKQVTGDYDFSSGGWTLFNSGGALTLPVNSSNNNTPQTNIVLGGISARYIGIEILTAGGTANRVGLAQVEATITDATAPELLTLSPSNGATGISPSTNMVATFSENISTNGTTGNITLTNLTSGASTYVIPVGDPQLTISGDTLTINPTGLLDINSTYAVLIDPGAIEDSSDNAFTGVTSTAAWQFQTTVDLEGPEITALSPLDDATDVQVDVDLVVNFNEPIVAGTGNITVRNLTATSDTVIPIGDSQVTLGAESLTVNMTSDMAYGADYAILIDAGAVEDSYANDFAGISTETEWNFTTDARPAVTVVSPANGTVNVKPNALLTVTFDETVSLVDSGTITVTNLTTGAATVITLPDAQVTASGSTVTIRLDEDLAFESVYAVLIDGQAVEDVNGNLFLGISDPATWQFTTMATDRNWSLVAYWPLDDGPAGSTVTFADDIIDDPSHPATDATPAAGTGIWTNDVERGVVYRTFQDERLSAGTQGITGDFTWSLWVKILEDNNGTIMGTRAGDWNKLYTGGIGGWAGAGFSSGTLATYGPWKHIVVRGTVNPGGANLKVELFIDGVLEGTDNATSDADCNGALQFGGNDSWSEDIGGMLSDIGIWVEALSDERIQELANGGLVFIPPPPGSMVILK